MDNKETIYPSKIDWWIAALLFGVPTIHIPLGIWLMMSLGETVIGILLIFWGLIIAMVFAALCFPCRYLLNDTSITIRSGLVTDSFGYSRVNGIVAKRCLTSAPALSLDRVEITLTDGTKRIISPVRQAEFIERVQHSAGLPD